MAKLQLHSECSCSTTISNKFIDNYISDANGEFVKVYLYLLRHLGNPAESLSISTIADFFNHTEKDILRALKYWEKTHLLRIEYNADKSISGLCLLDIDHMDSVGTAPLQAPARRENKAAVPPADTKAPSVRTTASAPAAISTTTAASTQAADSATATTSPAALPETKPQKRRAYTLDEVSEFKKDPNISELFFIIETYLKHPLSSTDINTILYWYENLHFSTELIVYLVEYCICKGHSSMRYIDKVALGWHENNITTVEQAKEQAAQHSQAYYGVMKALGITGRNLIDSETAYVNKWAKEYAFELSIIQEACRRTISATHQPSFEYTDKILTDWHKNQVHTPEDIQKLDTEHARNKRTASNAGNNNTAANVKRTKFTNFNQREYDYEELEKMLLTTPVH